MARNDVDNWCKEAVHQRERAEKAEAELAELRAFKEWDAFWAALAAKEGRGL